MSWQQVKQPRLTTNDGSGWCLRFAQSVFGAPVMHESAWIAWRNAQGRHASRQHPKNVAVVVWFEHWGVYGSPARWDNWGHVAVWVPGRGYLSSPVTFNSSWGQEWFPTLDALERALPGKYVGWSEGINGMRVIQPTPKPKPKLFQRKERTMRLIFNRDNRNNETRRALVGETTFHVLGPGAAAIERKLWGKPANVRQHEWNALLTLVNNRRALHGLAPLKGVRGEPTRK